LDNVIEALFSLKVPIESVKPDPRNARQHPARNLKAIMDSLDAYGQRKPIVVNAQTMTIEAGNGMWEAAQALGWDEIAVAFVKDDKAVASAYGIMDNQSALLAEWDLPTLKDLLQELDDGETNMELTGFTAEEIETLMTQFNVPSEGLTDDDEVPEQVETICKAGDLWELGNHRLLCGDATVEADVARLMANEKVDMVFTDPPYGIDYSGGRTQVVRHKPYGRIEGDGDSDISSFVEAVLALQARDIWLCCSPVNLAPALRPFDLTGGINAIIIWDKGNIGLGYQWVRRQCEFILFWTSRRKPKEGDSEKDLWDIATDDKKQLQHGSQKPVALIERALKFSQLRNVADLFGGSGSTLIACEKLGRKCRMMEIDEHYCDVIITRWQNFTGKQAVKL